MAEESRQVPEVREGEAPSDPEPDHENGGQGTAGAYVFDLNPVPKPPKGIKDKDLLQFIKEAVGCCEWIGGCDQTDLDSLAAHHIFGRGLGGGKRDDHPHKIAVLCHSHHNMGPVCAHNASWWGRDGKARLQAHIMTTRKPLAWKAIYTYMEGKGYPLGNTAHLQDPPKLPA